MKLNLSQQFLSWIIGGLIVLLSAIAVAACSVCSTSRGGPAWPFFCDAKITDLAVGYFTYCLVIVGWFGIKSSQEAAEITDRAYLWPGYGLMIEDQYGVRSGIHLGIRNTGRTVGILQTVHYALIAQERSNDPNNVITYSVYSGREDAIIPDPNAETRSGVWHLLSEMPKVSCGWITYRDKFGKTHRQGYKYLVHRDGRTDPLPGYFDYQPWNLKHNEIASGQEPLPANVKTVQITVSESA